MICPRVVAHTSTISVIASHLASKSMILLFKLLDLGVVSSSLIISVVAATYGINAPFRLFLTGIHLRLLLDIRILLFHS